MLLVSGCHDDFVRSDCMLVASLERTPRSKLNADHLLTVAGNTFQSCCDLLSSLFDGLLSVVGVAAVAAVAVDGLAVVGLAVVVLIVVIAVPRELQTSTELEQTHPSLLHASQVCCTPRQARCTLPHDRAHDRAAQAFSGRVFLNCCHGRPRLNSYFPKVSRV